MPKALGVAEAKKNFSEIKSRIARSGEKFVIQKKGKPMAPMVSIEDLEVIEKLKNKGEIKGLLAAVGAWEDFPEMEKVIADIYKKRKRSKDRTITGIF